MFAGSGARLGDSSTPTPSPSGTAGRAGTTQPAEAPYNPIVMLRMWRNGFTVNEGPLRPYNDPANKQFMDNVKKGSVPPELVLAAKGRDLKVQMEDKKDEEFHPPKQQATFFGGAGHMLGR